MGSKTPRIYLNLSVLTREEGPFYTLSVHNCVLVVYKRPKSIHYQYTLVYW